MNDPLTDLLILIPLLIIAGWIGWMMARSNKFYTPYDQKSMTKDKVGNVRQSEREKRVHQAAIVLSRDDSLKKIAEADRAEGKKEDPLKNVKVEAAFRTATQLNDMSLDEIEGEDRQRVLASYMFAYVAAEKRAEGNTSQ